MHHKKPSTAILASLKRKPITQANLLSSPLLRLPAEIRNAIYEWALKGTVVNGERLKQNSVINTTGFPSPLPLLLACRQIHFEATPVTFRECVFDLGHHPYPRAFFNLLYYGKRTCAVVKYILIPIYVSAFFAADYVETRKRLPSLRCLYVGVVYDDDLQVGLIPMVRGFLKKTGLEVIFVAVNKPGWHILPRYI